MFSYLTRHLGYSECDAMRRVRAARAARDYPSILRMLAEGELHLVGVAMLQPLLTSANHESLLRKAARRSTREIERLAAEISPACAGPRDRIRARPSPSKPCEPAAAPAANRPSSAPTEKAAVENGFVFLPELEIAAVPEEKALGVERRVVFTFTAGEAVRGYFEQARDLLRHRFPAGGMDEIIGEALRRLVAQERPGLGFAPKRRSAPRNESNRRRIPKRVEDEVWRRDGGRCAFIGSGGVRCGETAWLELDHVVPFALDGRSDEPANVRLLCRAHNQSEGRRIFG
ncbi:MAG: HNH endonuclease [Elusimicrobia bacterium]|nr:HNH endonuclease [Elusimicrobiota bacterium]